MKVAAVKLGLPVRQPEKIVPELTELSAIDADGIIVVGYGKLIPQSIIDLPRLGIINLHASLLPKYRGAAPINWAIIEGETRTGVTTMMIDAGLDTGDMLLKAEVAMAPDDDTLTLGKKLAAIGAPLLLETLDGLERGDIRREKQDNSQATIARRIEKEDGRADWSMHAVDIERRVRGFAPWPGVYARFRESTLRLLKARVCHRDTEGTEGELFVDGRQLFVKCGEGMLELIEVQSEGKKRMSAGDFLNGAHIAAGERL